MAKQRLSAEERRRQIVDTALEILSHDGPRALTLAGLGASLGIADAAVLRHFPNKAAIVDATIDRFGVLLNEDLDVPDGEPLARLGAFFIRRAHKIRRRPELMALAHNERLRDASDADGAARIDGYVQKSASFIHTCLDDALATGALRRDVPKVMWLWIVVGVVRGAARTLPAGLVRDDDASLTPEACWEALERLMRGDGPQGSGKSSLYFW